MTISNEPKNIMAHDTPHLRRICSFVRRQGRLTQHQKNALEHLFPLYGIPFQHHLINLADYFSCPAPLIIEIGFGMGKSLIQNAINHPDTHYLGIEVHTPGVGACLALAHEHQLNNLRIINHDAIEVLKEMIPNNQVDGVQLFFPDPWHKNRHHKRRIVQPAFAQLLWQKLKPGGIFHMATDWQDYAEHMLSVMNNAKSYQNCSPNNTYISRPISRPVTKFELRGQKLGHNVWDLMFKKIDESITK